MARLSDFPTVRRRIGLWGLITRVWQQVNEDNIYTWGAALAYSWLFAIFPFLIFLLSLVPLVPGRFKPDVQADVRKFVDQTMPPDAASVVMTVLTRPTPGGLLSIGLLITIWAASGGMSMTMVAVDKAYDIERGRPYYKQRLLAILLTMIVASLIILVMVLMPIGTGVLNWLINRERIFAWLYVLVNVLRYAVALFLLLAVLAIVYHFGPSFKQKFNPITPGAVFCLVVWLVLGAIFKYYVIKLGGAASYNKTYGAVAGAALLLLFFYIDALVLLVGAEINSEVDFAVLGVRDGQDLRQRTAKTIPACRD